MCERREEGKCNAKNYGQKCSRNLLNAQRTNVRQVGAAKEGETEREKEKQREGRQELIDSSH